MSQISPLERVALDEENPWNISEGHYPTLGSVPEQLRFLLGYAILAPSRSNSQPWQFHIVGDTVELWLDPSRSLPVADSRGREMYISCGTALFFLRIAAQYFGHVPQVELLPDLEQEGLLARVRLGVVPQPNESDEALFRAIRHRRTWMRPFRLSPLAPSLRSSLADAAKAEGALLVFLERSVQEAVAELAAQSEQELRNNPDYSAEDITTQATWVREIPNSLSEVPGQLAHLIARIGHAAQPPSWAAGQARREVIESPAIAILSTGTDTPYDWLMVGQALGLVLLQADISNVEASCLHSLAESLPLRRRLQALVGGSTPQVVLRLGYASGEHVTHVSRRPLHEVTMP